MSVSCQPVIDKPCLDAQTITSGGGQIIEQVDGSVSVWIKNPDGLSPYTNINTKPCCELLGYIFDIDNQKCLWDDSISCDTCELKIVVNPNGNDGDYFYFNSGDTCSLNVDLDYVFKFDCSILTSGKTVSQEALTITSKIEELNKTLEKTKSECATLSAQCTEYTLIYESICYPILISSHSEPQATPITDSNLLGSVTDGLINTGPSIGGPFLPTNSPTQKVCCLTEAGLVRWESILGEIKYNAWLSKNGCAAEYYTIEQAAILYNEGNNLADENNGFNPYLEQTDESICSKNESYLQMVDVCSKYDDCLKEISDIEKEISDLQDQLDAIPTALCDDPISNLENFQAWFSLDVETDVPMLYETVYEEEIFNIGENNLMQYIIDRGNSTGILISGTTGILPGFSHESTCDYNELCKIYRDNFMSELYLRQYVDAFGAPQNNVENAELLELMGNWYNSEWINYSTFIDDQEIIQKLQNRKIRISIKVNTCCLDFAVLLDKIKVTQNCNKLDGVNIRLSKPIGYDLEKVIDNKKSWVNSESLDRRLFELQWRGTDYRINHHKLSINTKEIDLNIDPALAIEGDLYNYIYANPCALDISSGSTEVCGDVNIDLTSFELTPLSEVTNVDEFNKIVYGEFIDVKNRQTISSYPLLRLLYERYLTSDNCTNLSNSYTYSDMDGITDLIGTYWVDLVEQFIPSTTIWGSTLVYRNTIFDAQKYPYKSNTLFVCEDPSKQFPFSAISSNCNTQIIKVQMSSNSLSSTGATPFDSSNFFSCDKHTYCNCVWTMTNYCFSEFVGAVIEDNEFVQYCKDTLYIQPAELKATIVSAPGCTGPHQTWDPINRIFTQLIKITDTSLVPITENYDYEVKPYGNNMSGITMTATSIDSSTIQIEWTIPSTAPNPTQQSSCPGYYVNTKTVNTPLPTLKPIWDVIPLIIIADPVFNCEIYRTFIHN